MLTKTFLAICVLLTVLSCEKQISEFPWENHGKLVANNKNQIIQYEDGTPFLWIGCTSWGMTEWLSREEVDLYLDDRKSKGINVVQFCLFWGKRVDYPTKFTANPPNFYGHKAFAENDSLPDTTQPALVEGGSPSNPNDYWDHVDYCLQAIKERGMYAAVLPFWGRRYVNAFHPGQSKPVFTKENISEYGKFLGKRYGNEPNIIWVNGGDVKADGGGDYLLHYRLFAEGLVNGVTGKSVKWNEKNDAWDAVFMTYHPDGSPMINSSKWFHNDPWLDFNMIETFVNRNYILSAIQQDLNLPNPKPTVLGEPHYEGITNDHKADAIHIRRQAYQSFFAGAAGFTYGGGFDKDGNGPLFSPANNWERLLNWEGASQLIHLRKFLVRNKWYSWQPAGNLISDGKGKGELEKVAVKSENSILIYFPDNSPLTLNLEKKKSAKWFNTQTGEIKTSKANKNNNQYSPPENWKDGVLVLE